VLIAGCRLGECHYRDGNYQALQRVNVLKEVLGKIGIDPGRVKIVWCAASEGEIYAKELREFIGELKAMGPIGSELKGSKKPKGGFCTMMEIEKEMEVEGSHIIAKQRTKTTEKVLDYDYKKCVGCSICIAICPKKALQEGPLQEIAKGLDAPPVLIDLDACVFCGMCANFCPLKAFKMTVEEKPEMPVIEETAAKAASA